MNKLVNFFIIVLVTVNLFYAECALAAEKIKKSETVLLDSYRRNLARLESNSFGLPLYVESYERDEKVHVDVYGIFNDSFSNIYGTLKVPGNWCDIVFLHSNIKACSYDEVAGSWFLNFYLGRKSYQPPEDVTPVITRFRNVDHQGYLDIKLMADVGPYGTRDHRMRFEAIPMEGGKTFAHVSYTYSDSKALRLATKIYFATIGHNKVGFTVTGKDGNGRPVYIGGPRGALERSAVRYYFAIQSFMNTSRYPEESRFNRRISEWHDLTSRFPKQLFDLSKNDYMAIKTREHKNQLTLQRRISLEHK